MKDNLKKQLKLKMPKLSFVMPTRNRDFLIKESIESILDQTHKDWELIIVDAFDSSPNDKTEEIVKKYNDSKIRYYKMPKKYGSGLCCSRNYGNFLANSGIIAIQDSDDLSMPNRAKLIIESYKKERWDVFYGQYLRLDDVTKEIEKPKRQPIKFSLTRYIKGDFFIPNSSSAYTKKIAMHYPYNSIFTFGEDFDFFTRLAADKKKFYFCPELIYIYRIHSKSITKGKGFKDLEKKIIKDRGWSINY
jgi:teichuronic acid biosynthesis glycosyltransferase TuaG